MEITEERRFYEKVRQAEAHIRRIQGGVSPVNRNFRLDDEGLNVSISAVLRVERGDRLLLFPDVLAG